MERKEAIAVLECLALEMNAILAGIPKSEAAADQIKRCIDAYDMAISALRQQGQERNAPLTLDELREMGGEPVWVQSPGVPEYGRWAIVEGVGENCLFLHDDFTCHDYGKTWLAYRQKPEEDKHEPN